MSERDVAWQAHPDGVVLTVRVQPRAARSEIVGLRDGAVRVRVSAPPVDGAANAALLDVLSAALDLPKRDLTVISGTRSRSKRVLAHGISADDVAARLRVPLSTVNAAGH